MEVWNQSIGVRLAWEVETAQSFWTGLRGWMGRDLQTGAALVIRQCYGIHTFFMREEIDVVFLDDEHRIVDMLHGVRPNQLAKLVRKAAHVIEFPAGTLSATGTQLHDRVLMETEQYFRLAEYEARGA
ncbi:DUF192 domain-containing protein [Tumebacillus permanentifrigoris]|uniref:DUF192 domain-containing protein n=1 Tax=Tumebacillus permanentifrigoris TaxID=378543 RepID=A0A316D8M4_9BACL|nr:DUF192 domain-containing protein [Tumebacillus permanentifrigoris]PWK12810.1 hypothetical protein C7459_109172 [Tumebacillus permanentifrigoris]